MMFKTQTKLTTGLALLALLGWGAFWVVSKRPLPSVEVKERGVYQDRVVYKDRIVTRDVTRTVTKPDGTKIVTAEKTDTKEHVAETEKTRQVEFHTTTAKTQYSLGIGVKLDPFNPLERKYSLELGRRLWNSPMWVRAGASTDKTLTLGLSIEF